MLSGNTNIQVIHNGKSRGWTWFWKQGFSPAYAASNGFFVRPQNRHNFEEVGVPVWDY